ncbi:MAG TPA: SpoIIE family protein phosphatase [Candidatus Tyrphobacter sp.]
MAIIPGLLPGASTGGRILLRTTVLAIVALLLVFAGSAIALRQAIGSTIRYDEAVHQAELQRSYLLRLQLDEETGLRGFALTGSPAYLVPLRQARRNFPEALRSLERSLRAVDPAMLLVLAQEQSLNTQWVKQIMQPTLARRRISHDPSIERRAKTLIDWFRALDDVIAVSLNNVAGAADRGANVLISRIVLWSTLFGLVLAIVLGYYAVMQARLVQKLDERTVALQRAFLFEPFPLVAGIAVDATYLAAEEELHIGGDWYGAFRLPGGRIFFTMGDVAGHGSEAAVLMSRARQSILSMAVHQSDPAVVLARANDTLRLRSQTMVTALCGFIDPETHEIAYASAGHPPPLEVTRDGEAAYLPHEGLPLGVVPDLACKSFTHVAPQGSTLVLYTDGLVEFDHNLLRGEERLREVAGAVITAGVARPASAILERALDGAPQQDDIAILTIHFVEGAA